MKLMHVEYGQIIGKPFERSFGFKPLDHADTFGDQGEIQWKGHPDYNHQTGGQSIMDKGVAERMGLLWDAEQGCALMPDGRLAGLAWAQPREFPK